MIGYTRQLAEGGLLFTHISKGLETQFNKDLDIGVPELITYPYEDFERLKELIDFYLDHPKEREYMRKVGHERTKRDHTYTQRMKTMLGILKKEGAI